MRYYGLIFFILMLFGCVEKLPRTPVEVQASICDISSNMDKYIGKSVRITAEYSANFELEGFSDARCGIYIPRDLNDPSSLDVSVEKFDLVLQRESLPSRDLDIHRIMRFSLDATVQYEKDPHQRSGGALRLKRVWSFRRTDQK